MTFGLPLTDDDVVLERYELGESDDDRRDEKFAQWLAALRPRVAAGEVRVLAAADDSHVLVVRAG